MLIVRFIFSILFAPIRILGNLFHPRDNLLEWHLIYGSYFLYIKSKYKQTVPDDDLLIGAYILFLARYFYICDERQIDLVKRYLQQEIGSNNHNPKELSAKIYNIIYDTLNPSEQKVVEELFIKGIPPLVYSDDEEPVHAHAHYSLFVYKHREKLADYFNLSLGSDIVLLPTTVGILYDYVIDKLEEKNNQTYWNFE